MGLKARRHLVLRIQDGDPRRFSQPVPPHHHDIGPGYGRILALLQIAQQPIRFTPSPRKWAWPGRYGFRCTRTPIGPAGPPPPCGIQNVLCKFKWATSGPNSRCKSNNGPFGVGPRFRDPSMDLDHCSTTERSEDSPVSGLSSHSVVEPVRFHRYNRLKPSVSERHIPSPLSRVPFPYGPLA